MSKEKLVPKLRFREFEDCDVWNSYKLGNTTQILTGGTPSTKVEDYWYPKEIPWMASGEINKKRLFKTDNLISNNGFENSSATWIKEKSVLIALAGQGKTRGTVAINEIPLTTNQSIAAILPFKNKIYPEFLFQNLDNRYEELRLVSSGDGTRGGLNKEIISELQVKAPNILEQKMIGNFFKKIDKMIQVQQSKVNKVKDIKSAYLSEMFPKEGEKYPKRRFEGFIEPWEQVQVQDLFKITRGHVLSATKVTEYPTKKMKYPVYSSQTKNNGLMGYYHKYLYQNAITWTTDGANAGTVSYRPCKFYCTNVSGVLISNEGYANRMIAEALNQIAWKHVSKVGNPKLMNNIMAEITVTIPQSIKEQHKIAEFIRNLDNQISIEEEKLAKLENLKQGYLNDMFV